MLNITTTIRIDEISQSEKSQSGFLTMKIAVKGAIESDEVGARFLAPISMPLQVGMVAVATMDIKSIGSYSIDGKKIWCDDPLIAEVYLGKLLQLMKAGVEEIPTPAKAAKAPAKAAKAPELDMATIPF
jgi:hypothetical protein